MSTYDVSVLTALAKKPKLSTELKLALLREFAPDFERLDLVKALAGEDVGLCEADRALVHHLIDWAERHA